MSHPDLIDEEAFLAAARARIASGAGAAVEKLTTLRPALHALTIEREVRDEVKVGQLWRLRWRATTELALVVAVDRWLVTVAPVTTDLDAADDYSMILPEPATPLGVSAAVCLSLECVVPLFIFDQLIAPAGRPTPAEDDHVAQLPLPETICDVWRAWRRGVTPPEHLTYGEPLLDGDLDRRELRTTLASAFTPLIGASTTAPGESARQPRAALPAMLKALQLPPSELARRTNLEREVFLRVVQGGRVNTSEAHALAALLDTDPETILAANPPLNEGLIVEVSRPRWRSDLRRLAHGYGTTEDDERWQLAEAVAASPRRTAHRPGDKDHTVEAAADQPEAWTALVEMHIRTALARLREANVDEP